MYPRRLFIPVNWQIPTHDLNLRKGLLRSHTNVVEVRHIKVLVPIRSLIPRYIFRYKDILVPEVESYLEGFMCEVSCTKSF